MSDYALANAFKREYGIAPGRHRAAPMSSGADPGLPGGDAGSDPERKAQ
ncbi:hypothetical protein [Actinomadura vinacea]